MTRNVSVKVFITVLATIFTLNEVVNFSRSLFLKLRPNSDLDESLDTVRRLKTDIRDIRALLGTLSHKIGALPNVKESDTRSLGRSHVQGRNKSAHSKQVCVIYIVML